MLHFGLPPSVDIALLVVCLHQEETQFFPVLIYCCCYACGLGQPQGAQPVPSTVLLQAHITVDQNFPEGQPRKIVIQGRPEACRRASTMVSELINGEPGSAQAIIQRVCQEVRLGRRP